MIPKFRAWDKANKKMYEVLAINFFHKVIAIRIDEEHFIQRKSSDFILMQSTDLKDKNGVEIFEGDVVKVNDETIFGGVYLGAIEHLNRWGVYGFSLLEAKVLNTNGFSRYSTGFLMREFGCCFTLAEASKNEKYTVEVIGNIHQNPELLESVEE